MKLFQAPLLAFKKYATFSGRAARWEYWYFFLFNVILNITFFLVDRFIFGANFVADMFSPFHDVYSLITLLPSIAIGVRRLHDINRSGWWTFFPLTIIGIIPYLYWACKKGTAGENRFGADPLEAL